MNAYTYLTFLIIALIVLAHLGLLYLVIRFAVTHALRSERRENYKEINRRLAADVFDKG